MEEVQRPQGLRDQGRVLGRTLIEVDDGVELHTAAGDARVARRAGDGRRGGEELVALPAPQCGGQPIAPLPPRCRGRGGVGLVGLRQHARPYERRRNAPPRGTQLLEQLRIEGLVVVIDDLGEARRLAVVALRRAVVGVLVLAALRMRVLLLIGGLHDMLREGRRHPLLDRALRARRRLAAIDLGEAVIRAELHHPPSVDFPIALLVLVVARGRRAGDESCRNPHLLLRLALAGGEPRVECDVRLVLVFVVVVVVRKLRPWHISGRNAHLLLGLPLAR
mmetsp:Transcript_102963/g.297708  ORF Transcript_102963/g.297708 Transcript_102963/m.297708 type:complete len:278 (-) Transcript_102963:597-1430(-)